MNWSERMSMAIDYIEANLKGELDIDQAARVACSSRYHFQRMFFAMFGITPADYVRKRRLTLAAKEIVASDLRIIDIALAYGYDSPNAFTRAFRSVHGINPSKARLPDAKLSAYNRVSFPIDLTGAEKLDYKIIEKPSFKLVGKSQDFEFETFLKDGPKFWKEYVGSEEYKSLCALTTGRPGSVTQAPLMSAYFPSDDGNRELFSDVLGLELAPELDPGQFDAYDVPATTYAEFNCTYRTAVKTNKYIYGEWFSATGYERDGNKPDIAAYFPIAFRSFGEMGVRWWVPVVANNV